MSEEMIEEGMENTEEGMENTEEENEEITESNDSGLIEEDGEEGYSPDYSFKVRNDDFEFDEKLKPFITSKEIEDHVRELYTKSHGIDYLKKGLDEKSSAINQLTSNHTQLKEEYDAMMYGFNKLDSMAKKDFTNFQKSLKISDDIILNRAAEILEYQEADQFKRQEIDRLYRERMDGYSKENELMQLQKQNEVLYRNQHDIAFNQAFNDPQVSGFKEEFDSRMGEGAFEKQVREFGSVVWNTQKKYIPPHEAVNAIMGRYSPFIGGQPTNGVSSQSETTTHKTVADAPKPIPNLGGGKSANPTKRKFKSLAEMRKYGEELQRQELLRQYD